MTTTMKNYDPSYIEDHVSDEYEFEDVESTRQRELFAKFALLEELNLRNLRLTKFDYDYETWLVDFSITGSECDVGKFLTEFLGLDEDQERIAFRNGVFQF